MQSVRVLLLEDDDDVRGVLADWLVHFGRPNPLALASVDALKAARDEALGCELAILDVNLGTDQPSGVDALKWLRAEGFQGRVAFLTGHSSSSPLVCDAGVPVLAKPLESSDLRALLAHGHDRAA
jgi:DNA-binding response OmpR family regulator